MNFRNAKHLQFVKNDKPILIWLHNWFEQSRMIFSDSTSFFTFFL